MYKIKQKWWRKYFTNQEVWETIQIEGDFPHDWIKRRSSRFVKEKIYHAYLADTTIQCFNEIFDWQLDLFGRILFLLIWNRLSLSYWKRNSIGNKVFFIRELQKKIIRKDVVCFYDLINNGWNEDVVKYVYESKRREFFLFCEGTICSTAFLL